MGYPIITKEQMDMYISNGWVVSADTIEDLASLAGMEEDNNLVATVNRYNELVEQGKDTDFYKDSKYLKEIKTPPFYANIFDQYILSIPSGLQVDEYCSVMSTDNKLIEGLYALGNCQGGMYGGTDYPFAVNCGSTGRCVVFGWDVGRRLAGA
jgi:succinate dehydrogenase/fumarate reductase flavoprotein subunit